MTRHEHGDGICRRLAQDLQTRFTKTVGDRMRRRDRCRADRAHRDRRRGGPVRGLERGGECAHELVCPFDRAAQRGGDGVERRVGQSALELLDHPLLPAVRMLQHGDLVGAELQAVR